MFPQSMTKPKIIQVLGTSSNSGKTVIAMILCRYLSDRGHSVAPFKSINMSLNSVSLSGGYEISRSVWLQSTAARTVPSRYTNPFLLKPEGRHGSQVIMLGRSRGIMTVDAYYRFLRSQAPGVIRKSVDRLTGNYDVLVAEGAGSPAEINLAHHDFSNIFVSALHGTPAILVGDIDRGGVFASLYGTIKLMRKPELVRWLIINKMSGNFSMLRPGFRKLEKLTGKTVIGVMPYVGGVTLPGEDSLDYIHERTKGGSVAMVRYPFMENYSDIDPLYAYGTGLNFITPENADELSAARLIILPGSKRVDDDLNYLRSSGLADAVLRAAERGAFIVGICGGYQMLGKKIRFRAGSSNSVREMDGLGLLNVTTVYSKRKNVRRICYSLDNDIMKDEGQYEGYEIHYGEVLNRSEKSLLRVNGQGEGAISVDKCVFGTNIHGILENSTVLNYLLGSSVSREDYQSIVNRNIDRLVSEFVSNVDMSEIDAYIDG